MYVFVPPNEAGGQGKYHQQYAPVPIYGHNSVAPRQRVVLYAGTMILLQAGHLWTALNFN